MPRIELINVSKRWGDFVGVDSLNMIIEDREFITLLGPSGCGKTTTLRMIAGLETPTEGRIIIGNKIVFDKEEGINLPPNKRNIGFLFQNYALWPHMTVYKNIAFGLENLKEAMPLIDNKYATLATLIRILKEPLKIKEIVLGATAEGKREEVKKVIINLIEELDVSTSVAKALYKYKYQNMEDEAIKADAANKIDMFNLKLQSIKDSYISKGKDIDEKGFVYTKPIKNEEFKQLVDINKVFENEEEVINFIFNLVDEKELKNELFTKFGLSNKVTNVLLGKNLDYSSLGAVTTRVNEVKEIYKLKLRDLKARLNEDGLSIDENYNVIPHLDLENKEWDHKLVHEITVRHMTKEEMDIRVHEVARTLKISEFLERYPAELSGGQQQRVAIARTLAPGPKVLFMDEPLSNLDAKLRGEMRTELKRLHKDTDSTFIYVTHDQLEAMTLATRICLMRKGFLQQYDKPLIIYREPANVFVADFVGNPTMNFIPATGTKTKDNKIVDIDLFKTKARFISKEPIELLGDKVIIGVRPEFLPINPDGELEGTAYSTLPAGMETTVKIDLHGDILSAVQFGLIDYQIDEKIRFNIIGDSICLFDAISKKKIALGTLEIVK